MTISTADIQSLYIAYFNRPADPLGLQYYQTSVGATVTSIGNAFAASPEYTSIYAGKQPAEIINTIYLNLFGRAAEPAGILFWGDALAKGYVTTGNVALQILQGAQNADKIAITSKISAATAFTTSLDTTAEIVGYSGSAANGVASDWLKAVVDKATLDAATSADALLAVSTAATAAHDGQNNTGSTFSTTVAIDTIVGTNGNDIINVFASGTKADGSDGATLSANDSIDGGAGIDTLNLEVLTGFNIAQSGTVKNVEIINISGAELLGTVPGTIDATKYQGSTNINIQSAAGAVIVEGLAGKTLGVGAGYDAATISANFNAAAATVALSDVATGLTVEIVNAKSTTLNLSGTVGDDAGDPGTVTLTNAGAKVATLNLNLKSDAIVEVAGLAALTSIVSTGAASVDVSDAAATVKSITTAGGDDSVAISFVTAAAAGAVAAKNATVSTGAGDDTISVTTSGTGLTSVDAGAGDDTIAVTKAAGNALSILGGAGDDKVTITGVALATTDVIDGGDGTDTIAVAGSTTARVADDFIVLTKVIKNFESLQLTSAEGTAATLAAAGTPAAEVALDASKLAGYTTLTFNAPSFVNSVAANQALVVNGSALTASAAGYIAKGNGSATSTTYAGTLNLSDKIDASTVTARADTVNLTVASKTTHNDAVNTTGVALTGDVKTAVVTINNGVDTDSTDGSVQHDNLATVTINTTSHTSLNQGSLGASDQLGKLASLTLTGTGHAIVTNGAGSSLTTIDASGLGGTYTVTDAVAGTTKGDATLGLTYSTSNTAVETIKLGAGVDSVTIAAGSTYGKVDSVAGLTLVVDSTGATPVLAAGSDLLIVTGATAAVKVTTTQTDIDLALKDFAAAHINGTVVFALGGDTYVYHDVGATALVDQGKVDASDILVKLVGTVNLDALVLSLG